MARRRVRPGMVRWLSGLLVSVLIVAAVSGLLVLLKTWLLPLRVLYILAVVPVAIVWGTGFVGKLVIPEIVRHPEFELVGVGVSAALAFSKLLIGTLAGSRSTTGWAPRSSCRGHRYRSTTARSG